MRVLIQCMINEETSILNSRQKTSGGHLSISTFGMQITIYAIVTNVFGDPLRTTSIFWLIFIHEVPGRVNSTFRYASPNSYLTERKHMFANCPLTAK